MASRRKGLDTLLFDIKRIEDIRSFLSWQDKTTGLLLFNPEEKENTKNCINRLFEYVPIDFTKNGLDFEKPIRLDIASDAYPYYMSAGKEYLLMLFSVYYIPSTRLVKIIASYPANVTWSTTPGGTTITGKFVEATMNPLAATTLDDRILVLLEDKNHEEKGRYIIDITSKDHKINANNVINIRAYGSSLYALVKENSITKVYKLTNSDLERVSSVNEGEEIFVMKGLNNPRAFTITDKNVFVADQGVIYTLDGFLELPYLGRIMEMNSLSKGNKDIIFYTTRENGLIYTILNNGNIEYVKKTNLKPTYGMFGVITDEVYINYISELTTGNIICSPILSCSRLHYIRCKEWDPWH